MNLIRIPAVYMRGGTSKGVFFRQADLPDDPVRRDQLLLRVIGSPDPYGKHMDGMGGATSSTSKVVVIGPSSQPECDVDYWFGAVPINGDQIDWSGNCGNLSSAVGPFALFHGMVAHAPTDGVATVRIWQANTRTVIHAQVPVAAGQPVEVGDYRMDGVAFPGAEQQLDFLDPAGGAALLPTGRVVDELRIPGAAPVAATLLNAGNPTVFVRAADLGLQATELPAAVDADGALMQRLEALRAAGAVAMGLAASPEWATSQRPATPKIAFVAPPQDYVTSKGDVLPGEQIDICARILSMGKTHHAFTGTGAIATAVAAVLPGSIVAEMARSGPDGRILRIGHASGVIEVGATVSMQGGHWYAEKAIMRRSARRLMEGWVWVPLSQGPG